MATTIARPAVPTLSLADEATDPVAFAGALGISFERYGFAIVSDHGIAPEVIVAAARAAKAFFALPDVAKRRYYLAGTGGARGYTPFGIETARDAAAHDLKEFWHIGRELPPGHPFAADMPPNRWPDEVAGFRRATLTLHDALERIGARLLGAIARHLDLPPDFFADPVRDGNSVLRLLHYPPTDGGGGASIRAGAHEDINVITLLLGAEEAGLELLDRDGNWLPVRPREGELAVNVGDMLQRLTNGVLRSTTHRVMNPAPARRGVARYSMPFFHHFRPDFVIRTLPGCVSAERPDHFPEPVTANAYLLRRLREIGLL